MGLVEKYSIADLEVLTGIKAATIRIWEKRYQIITPHRTTTNIRYYSNDHLKQLLNINALNKAGLKISKIAKMSAEEIHAKVNSIAIISNADDDLSDGFFRCLLSLDEQLFHSVFVRSVSHLGFEGAFIKIIFPFFKRIGLMWQTGAINPAQEHFFSNLVRQKLLAAIDLSNATPITNNDKYLLFCPENELHELGLLFLNYLLKRKGCQTVYLGQALPLVDLDRVLTLTQPNKIILSVSNFIADHDAKHIIHQLASKKDVLIYIAGEKLHNLNISSPAFISYYKDLNSLYSAL